MSRYRCMLHEWIIKMWFSETFLYVKQNTQICNKVQMLHENEMQNQKTQATVGIG